MVDYYYKWNSFLGADAFVVADSTDDGDNTGFDTSLAFACCSFDSNCCSQDSSFDSFDTCCIGLGSSHDHDRGAFVVVVGTMVVKEVT